jgi:hypothetical protein
LSIGKIRPSARYLIQHILPSPLLIPGRFWGAGSGGANICKALLATTAGIAKELVF